MWTKVIKSELSSVSKLYRSDPDHHWLYFSKFSSVVLIISYHINVWLIAGLCPDRTQETSCDLKALFISHLLRSLVSRTFYCQTFQTNRSLLESLNNSHRALIGLQPTFSAICYQNWKLTDIDWLELVIIDCKLFLKWFIERNITDLCEHKKSSQPPGPISYSMLVYNKIVRHSHTCTSSKTITSSRLHRSRTLLRMTSKISSLYRIKKTCFWNNFHLSDSQKVSFRPNIWVIKLEASVPFHHTASTCWRH